MPLNIPARTYGLDAESEDIERRLKELESFVFQDLRRLLDARKGVLRVASDGSLMFGPTNGYVHIDKSDGTLTLNGDARTWVDIQPYATFNGQGPAALALAQYGTTGFYMYRWTNSAAADETYQFGFQMPHQMLLGSSAHFHLHVVPSANGAVGNQDVVMRASYQWVNVDGTLSTTTNTSVTQTFTVGTGDGNDHKIFEFDEFLGPDKGLSSALIVTVARLSKTSASDNYTGDLWLLFSDVHVQVDSLGSSEELTK